MSLSRVPGEDELYIGGIFTLNRRAALQAANITHIVSVLRYDFKDFSDWNKYEHCSVQVDDVEDENLLEEFARTGKFIKEGLQRGGGVLVHCAMGRSRSVTVTLAYLLSTRPKTCPDVPTALALVRETRPMADPNSGFMTQLELYKAMGCPSDVDAEPMYQRWLYKLEVDLSLAVGRAPERLRFEDEQVTREKDDDDASSSLTGEREGKEKGEGEGEGEVGGRGGAGVKELRCRKCRRPLATRQYLIPHIPKSPSSTATTTTTSSATPAAPTTTTTTTTTATIPDPQPTATPTASPQLPPPPPCTHHFIHPLSWMRPTLSEGHLAGRLACPGPGPGGARSRSSSSGCGQQVGRYAWQGLRCSCGHWVVPGFSLAAGKVDEVFGGGKNGAGIGTGMGAGMPLRLRMPPAGGKGGSSL